jgi:hypothetical protein
MVVLSIEPGAFDTFALVLDEKDSLSGLRSSIAEELSLAEGAAADFVLKYELDGNLVTLEDGAWICSIILRSLFWLNATRR